MSTFKNYALQHAKVVVLTVHQPSSRIFQMFDSILLLSNGTPAYFGPTAQVVPYIENTLSCQIQQHYNPADFMIEQLLENETQLVATWAKNCQPNNIPQKGGISQYSLVEPWPTTFWEQTITLAHRNRRLATPRILSMGNIMQTLLLAGMSGAVWYNTPRDEDHLKDLEGWMYFSTNYWMLFVLFQSLWTIPIEMPVIKKEILSGAYRFSSYFLAKLVTEDPLDIFLPSLYLGISYSLLGGTLLSFWAIVLAQCVASLASKSIGLFLGSLCKTQSATTAAAVFTVASQLLGGYLTRNDNFSKYFKIFSIVYNGIRNLQIAEYIWGGGILCAEFSQFDSCKGVVNGTGFVTMEDLLWARETEIQYSVWAHLGVLGLCIFVFRYLTFLALNRSF